MKENWKDIEGFPGYQISDQGRVRSWFNNKYGIGSEYHIMKTSKDKRTGYVKCSLWQNNKGHTKAVHRLVAEAFCSGKVDGYDVNHIDGNKLNNYSNNLEWVTRSDNNKHAYKLGLKKPSNKRVGSKPFLYSFQMDAVNEMFNGCILNGSVGSGKSRTGLFYYFKNQGGWIDENGYTPMKVKPRPKDLYIITTAKKRNSCEWQGELAHFLLSADENQTKRYGNKIVIDSWNNIQKYIEVTDGFFIFDEDRVTGNGAWVKAFLKITKHNEWIILSATAGDQWNDYIPVFIANGFYKNRTEFAREHIIYSRFTKYPKIDRYINTGRLNAYRNKLLIDMDFKRSTIRHNEDVYVKYNTSKYRDVTRTRWDIYKNEPIQQASGLCYVLRRIVNEDVSRQVALLELYEKHPKMIIFYNFNYERDILLNLAYGDDVTIAQYNGSCHDPLPEGDKWVYLVQYTAGAEGWNAITTDTIVFYSQTYSYKTLEQARGRIDRLTTPFTDLYYYHLKSRSGIDLAISQALSKKKNFNEGRWVKW